MFVSDYPDMIIAIREAVKTKNAEVLRRNAHSLKGMARNFQVESAAQTAFELEEMGRKEEFEGAGRVCDSLVVDLAGLEKALLGLLDEMTSKDEDQRRED